MSIKLSNSLRVVAGVAPQDITTARTGDYVDVSGAQRILAAVTTATIAQTKKVTVQFKQAKDADGTGAKDLGDAVVATAPTGGAALTPVAEANIGELDSANGFTFVAVNIVSDNGTAVYGGAVMILGDNRYNP
jgi:hypothetical protein